MGILGLFDRRRERAPRLLEGLPHPAFESQLFDKERARDQSVQNIHGSWFYKQALTLDPAKAHEIRKIVADPTSYSPWRPGKRCGGFHADYAVEWLDGTVLRCTVICFGCGEAKTFGPITREHHDLTAKSQSELESLFHGVRVSRPVRPGPTQPVNAEST